MSGCIPDGAVVPKPLTDALDRLDATIDKALARIAALEAEAERQVRLVADWRGDHEDETTEEEATFLGCPWRKPTHGTCCTCQRCGADHDDCICMPSDAFFVAYNRLKALPTEAEVVEAVGKMYARERALAPRYNEGIDQAINAVHTLYAAKAKETK